MSGAVLGAEGDSSSVTGAQRINEGPAYYENALKRGRELCRNQLMVAKHVARKPTIALVVSLNSWTAAVSK